MGWSGKKKKKEAKRENTAAVLFPYIQFSAFSKTVEKLKYNFFILFKGDNGLNISHQRSTCLSAYFCSLLLLYVVLHKSHSYYNTVLPSKPRSSQRSFSRISRVIFNNGPWHRSLFPPPAYHLIEISFATLEGISKYVVEFFLFLRFFSRKFLILFPLFFCALREFKWFWTFFFFFLTRNL